eukprot:175496_1
MEKKDQKEEEQQDLNNNKNNNKATTTTRRHSHHKIQYKAQEEIVVNSSGPHQTYYIKDDTLISNKNKNINKKTNKNLKKYSKKYNKSSSLFICDIYMHNKGYGFVTFKYNESAQSALHEPNKKIDGRQTHCNYACERSNINSSGGG